MLALVIGAGPAGLRVAHGLHSQGLSATLVDSEAPGGTLNLGLSFDYIDPDSGATTTAGALKEQLLAPWGRFGPPMLQDRVLEARWDSRARVWGLRLENHPRRIAPWLVLATGVVPRSAGIKPSSRVYVGPAKSVYERRVAGERIAILGGGDNAFEFACHAMERGASIRMFLRKPRAQAKFVDQVKSGDVFPPATIVSDRGDSVVVNGERFDACFVFYGFEGSPFPLVADGKRIETTSDGRYESPCSVRPELSLCVVGDVHARSPLSMAEAMRSADEAVAALVGLQKQLGEPVAERQRSTPAAHQFFGSTDVPSEHARPAYAALFAANLWARPRGT